ncbi:uncharacterized protein BDW47DRAFT_127144 [Aspergillus candidus]|uniref:Uncharacterized protein n=1 Tax=Aspergillus candidus TaxID=41067 RepID=A0A2I2F7G8_ASPCN|nr:hypothetical protein BDW47DRAFT_127144 [Aspergillus candidus]PLB36566.1 hypothetical protein BDW47DRAFT_127144 [Aspergillus candidus]
MQFPHFLSCIFLLSSLSLAGPISHPLPDASDEDPSLAERDIPGCFPIGGGDMLSCPGQSPAIQFEKSTKNSAPTGRPCIPIGGSDLTYCPDSGKTYGGRFPIDGRSPDDAPSALEDDVEASSPSSANPKITPFPDPPTKRQAPQASETFEITFNSGRTVTLTVPYGYRLDRINQPRPVAPTAAPAAAAPNAGLTARRSTITSTRVVTVTVLGPSPAAPAPTAGYSALLPAPPRPAPPVQEEPQMGLAVTPVSASSPDTAAEPGVVVPTSAPDDDGYNDEEEDDDDDELKVIPVHTTM